MKGDFSRLTFDPTKRYSSVRQQQGRVLLDADWNEQQDILNHRIEQATIDQMGRCVVPTIDDFRLDTVVGPAGPDLKVRPGRAYVEGTLVEQRAQKMPVAVVGSDQIKVPSLRLDDHDLAVGQWLDVAYSYTRQVSESSNEQVSIELQVEITGVDLGDGVLTVHRELTEFAAAFSATVRRFVTFKTQPDLPAATLPTLEGSYLAYLDVWQRQITSLEDPDIVEVALGGPDTTTRIKTLWQLKLTGVSAGAECESFSAGWTPPDARAEPIGQLRARASATATLENQLYRVEAHQKGNEANATFKWSRDNGVVVAPIVAVGTETITFSQAVRDEERQFEVGQWVEVLDDEKTLRGEPGLLVEITGVEELKLTLLKWPTADGAPPALGSNPIVRGWNSAGELAVSTQGFLPLEDGVEIQFAAGQYEVGDYWLIPARRDVNNVLWQVDPSGQPVPQPPRGIYHKYCALGLVQLAGGAWTVISDCRPVVPASSEVSDAKVDRAGDTMTGLLTLEQGVDVQKVGTFRAGLSVTGKADVFGDLEANDIKANRKLTVDGASQLNGALTVSGESVTNESLRVGKKVTADSLEVTGKLDVTASRVDIRQPLTAHQKADLQAGLSVTGATDVDQLTVDGNATLSAGLQVTGAASVDGTLTVQGEVKSTVGSVDHFMVPRGAIIMWSGSVATIPAGWVLCNGSNGTPDLRDRFIAGAGVDGTPRASGAVGPYRVNDRGGDDFVTLNVAQMPHHSHDYEDLYFMEHWGYVNVGNRLGCGHSDRDNWGYQIRRTSYGQGGNQAHENRPRFWALAFIMKT